jgi:hypothetical protein
VAAQSFKQILIVMGAFASAIFVSSLYKEGIVSKAFEDYYYIGVVLTGIVYLALTSYKSYQFEKLIDWPTIAILIGSVFWEIAIVLRINGVLSKAQDDGVGRLMGLWVAGLLVWQMSLRNKKARKSPEAAS